MHMDKNSLIRFVDLEQGTDEWKEFRKGKLGSSVAASIMGVGFKTPLQLFEDIMQDNETPVNEAMLRGTRLEPIARQCINEKYGSNLQPVVVEHPDKKFNWHISSLDGFYKNPDGSIFVCEIKCPGMVDHQKALEGEIPEKYIPQLYHILEDLPGVNRILYFSYTPTSQAEVWFVRNEEKMEEQFKAEKEFYKRILDCKPPEPMDNDWVYVSDPSLIMKAAEYQEVCRQIDVLEEEKDKLKKELINTDTVRSKVGSLKIQRVNRVGSVDYSKIEVLKGMDLSPYRNPNITTWRLST